MKPTMEQLTAACRALKLIPFYPKEDHDLALDQIAKFAGRADALEWFVDAAVNAMKQWSGIGDLRGLWCTRFPPADGIEASCSLPGHTPADIETENIQTHDALLAPDRQAPRLAEGKLLPASAEQPQSVSPVMHKLIDDMAERRKLKPEENYEPPEWLKNIA